MLQESSAAKMRVPKPKSRQSPPINSKLGDEGGVGVRETGFRGSVKNPVTLSEVL